MLEPGGPPGPRPPWGYTVSRDPAEVDALVERVSTPLERASRAEQQPRAPWLWLTAAGVTLVLLVVTVLALVLALRNAQSDLTALRRQVERNSRDRTAQLMDLQTTVDGLRRDVQARDAVIVRLVDALRAAGVDPGPVLSGPAPTASPSSLEDRMSHPPGVRPLPPAPSLRPGAGPSSSARPSPRPSAGPSPTPSPSRSPVPSPFPPLGCVALPGLPALCMGR